jgi:glycine/D-amino acid oxidase-like deaminating enzyme
MPLFFFLYILQSPLIPEKNLNINTDIIVIGGGINGVCTAFHLAKSGVDVMLLEKSFIAGGPTGLSSAIVRQHYSNPVTARMALNSLQVWKNFSEVTGAEPVFTNEVFMIGVRPEDVEGLKANIKMQQSTGINTQFISPKEMRDIDPNLDVSGLGGGAYEPESGYCDPAASASGFALAAGRLGAEIRTGITATNLILDSGRIMGVETDQGIISGAGVIVAAGPWTPHILSKVGIKVPIKTTRVNVVLYKKPAEFKHHGVWADFISQIYLRPETGGLMLVGSISPKEETDDQIANPDAFNDKVELDIISSFAERAAMRYPAMQKCHVHSSFASLYDLTPDWHHILDAVPDIEGLYICAGTSGHGFKLGPAVGEMMANLVVNGKSPEDDINLFSFDRFEAGHPISGQYEYSILG